MNEATSEARSEAGSFQYLFESLPASKAELAAWIAAKEGDPAMAFYAVVSVRTGQAQGRLALMRAAPEHQCVEVGGIYFGPALRRTPGATEAVFLAASLCFGPLAYQRLEWKCDALNAPSRRAALRLGFRFEGLFRRHMVVKGRRRDTAWYAMTGEDWFEGDTARPEGAAPEGAGASALSQRRPSEAGKRGQEGAGRGRGAGLEAAFRRWLSPANCKEAEARCKEGEASSALDGEAGQARGQAWGQAWGQVERLGDLTAAALGE
jgi:RimJ/RimL family protein N-acetyltransferase